MNYDWLANVLISLEKVLGKNTEEIRSCLYADLATERILADLPAGKPSWPYMQCFSNK